MVRLRQYVECAALRMCICEYVIYTYTHICMSLDVTKHLCLWNRSTRRSHGRSWLRTFRRFGEMETWHIRMGSVYSIRAGDVSVNNSRDLSYASIDICCTCMQFDVHSHNPMWRVDAARLRLSVEFQTQHLGFEVPKQISLFVVIVFWELRASQLILLL